MCFQNFKELSLHSLFEMKLSIIALPVVGMHIHSFQDTEFTQNKILIERCKRISTIFSFLVLLIFRKLKATNKPVSKKWNSKVTHWIENSKIYLQNAEVFCEQLFLGSGEAIPLDDDPFYCLLPVKLFFN